MTTMSDEPAPTVDTERVRLAAELYQLADDFAALATVYPPTGRTSTLLRYGAGLLSMWSEQTARGRMDLEHAEANRDAARLLYGARRSAAVLAEGTGIIPPDMARRARVARVFDTKIRTARDHDETWTAATLTGLRDEVLAALNPKEEQR